MLAIYELIGLLPKSFNPVFSERLNDLYNFLKKERLTEEEASQKFLKSDQRKKYFNKLKNKLKTALINHLMVNPPIWADSKQKELFDSCHKDFVAYKILLTAGKRTAANDMAKKLLLKAFELESYEIVYMIAGDLEYHYSAIEVSISTARRHARMADMYLELINAERLLKRHLNRVMQIYNTKNTFTATNIAVLEEATSNVLPLLKLSSPKLNRLIYNTVIARYYATYDYCQVKKYCDQALASFPDDHPN